MPRYFTLLLSYIIGHYLLIHLNEGQSVLSMDIIHSIVNTGCFRHGSLGLYSHVILPWSKARITPRIYDRQSLLNIGLNLQTHRIYAQVGSRSGVWSTLFLTTSGRKEPTDWSDCLFCDDRQPEWCVRALRLSGWIGSLKGWFGVNSPVGPLHHDIQPNTPSEPLFFGRHWLTLVKLVFFRRLSTGRMEPVLYLVNDPTNNAWNVTTLRQ